MASPLRRAGITLGVALAAGTPALVACSQDSAPLPVTEQRPDGIEVPAPEAAGPEPPATGTVARRARRIARDIMDRFGLVQVWRAVSAERGRVVIYAVRFRLDDRSQHPDFDDWNSHVRRAARDQREAVVTMLKQTVTVLPRVRLVSVYQDELLQPFWSRRQIEAMGDPIRYRQFEAWQDLVLSAARLPGRPG